MIVAIAFAHVWGVLQLILLGSLTRTTRVRTVLTAIAAGFYACATLAVLLQASWTRVAAWLTDTSSYKVAEVAGYTADPVIEEIVKLLPLLLLTMIPAIRRQWSITDCVLMGAAAGSGFGLAEDIYRYGEFPRVAAATHFGWMIGTNISMPVVPSVWNALRSWLPAPVAPDPSLSLFEDGSPWINLHLVWSAIGGLGVGLIRLRGGIAGRIAGAFLLIYIAADHAAYNAGSAYGSWVKAVLSAPLGTVRNHLGLMMIAALAVAFWLDWRRQHAARSLEPALAAERSASVRVLGTLRAALSRLPVSLYWVSEFVRVRRAYAAARIEGTGAAGLERILVDLRSRIDRAANAADRRLLQSGRSNGWVKTLLQPMFIVWFVVMLPSILWLVVGGSPETAGIQKTMVESPAWKVIFVLSAVGQACLVWQLIAALRLRQKLTEFLVGDAAAVISLRFLSGVGTVALGGYALMRAFTGQPTSGLLASLHALQAVFYLPVGLALILTGPGGAFGLGLGKTILADIADDDHPWSGSGYTGGGGEFGGGGSSGGGGSGDSYGDPSDHPSFEDKPNPSPPILAEDDLAPTTGTKGSTAPNDRKSDEPKNPPNPTPDAPKESPQNISPSSDGKGSGSSGRGDDGGRTVLGISPDDLAEIATLAAAVVAVGSVAAEWIVSVGMTAEGAIESIWEKAWVYGHYGEEALLDSIKEVATTPRGREELALMAEMLPKLLVPGLTPYQQECLQAVLTAIKAVLQ